MWVHHPAFAVGDQVVLNGWGVGEGHWGGLAERARVPGKWLIPLQPPFSPRQAMGIGTAGYTAALCVMALERHGSTPDKGPVVVTGAAGGVGSVAVAMLSKLGYEVAAVTGRPQEADFLTRLGARHIIDRAELAQPGRPLEKERWAGAVDVAGGQLLANVCAAMGRQPTDAVLDTVDFEGSGNYAGDAAAPQAMMMRSAKREMADEMSEPSFEPGETTLQMRVVGKVKFK